MSSPNVLAIIFSPPNVICTLGTVIDRLGENANVTLGICDWPGMSAAENHDRYEAFRRMTSSVPFIRQIAQITDDMVARAVSSNSVQETLQEVRAWIGHPIDELHFPIDLHGFVYPLICATWPKAYRVSFGDGFGHFCSKEDFLSLRHGDSAGYWPTLPDEWKRRFYTARFSLKAHFGIGNLNDAALTSFSGNEFRTFMPISDYGFTLPSHKLHILSKTRFFEAVDFIRKSVGAADYEAELLQSASGRPAIILATENYVESGLLTMEQEIPMWLDMLEPYLAGNPLIVVKRHPGETQARWPLLAERLAGRAEVCDFAPIHQRLPLEIFTGLVGRFEFVTSAFLRVSLNYMHGAIIANPMTETIVQTYFPEWFRPQMDKISRSQDRYIAALAGWDRKGMLYSEQTDRRP